MTFLKTKTSFNWIWFYFALHDFHLISLAYSVYNTVSVGRVSVHVTEKQLNMQHINSNNLFARAFTYEHFEQKLGEMQEFGLVEQKITWNYVFLLVIDVCLLPGHPHTARIHERI